MIQTLARMRPQLPLPAVACRCIRFSATQLKGDQRPFHLKRQEVELW